MWVFTFAMLIIVVFGIYQFQQFETPLNRFKASSYLAFSRTAWSLAIAWIIFASIHGYGGVINTFLSWSGFIVLGKLGYTMFLTHLCLQFASLAALKTPQYFTMFNEVSFFISILSSFRLPFVYLNGFFLLTFFMNILSTFVF